jgi:hypothetical protein
MNHRKLLYTGRISTIDIFCSPVLVVQSFGPPHSFIFLFQRVQVSGIRYQVSGIGYQV